jgi:hypothetical protein
MKKLINQIQWHWFEIIMCALILTAIILLISVLTNIKPDNFENFCKRARIADLTSQEYVLCRKYLEKK